MRADSRNEDSDAFATLDFALQDSTPHSPLPTPHSLPSIPITLPMPNSLMPACTVAFACLPVPAIASLAKKWIRREDEST